MADRFYGVLLGGDKPSDVSESGSTTSRAVELRVSDAIYTNRLAVVLAVRGLLAYLETVETDPIA